MNVEFFCILFVPKYKTYTIKNVFDVGFWLIAMIVYNGTSLKLFVLKDTALKII